MTSLAELNQKLSTDNLQDAERHNIISNATRYISTSLELPGTWHIAVEEKQVKINYTYSGYRLGFSLTSSFEKSWFHIPGIPLAVKADSPVGPNSAVGQKTLRKIQTFLQQHPTEFKEFSNRLYSERFTEEDLGLFKEEFVSEELNKASFHFLSVFKNGARLEKVQRPGKQQWFSVSNGEFYPWPGAVGTDKPRVDIYDAWKRYADSYEQHRLPLSIYVHIPFCARKCNFCHCAMKELDHLSEVDKYVDALIDEIHKHAAILSHIPLVTFYIGGGTPSVCSAATLRKLILAVKESFTFGENFQFSIEANPDSLTEEKIDAVHSLIPIDRLSMGIQTIDPEAQIHASRHNNPNKIHKLVAHARKVGVKYIHVDLISGLDGLLYRNFRRDFKTVLRFKPNTVKVYGYRPFYFRPGTLEVVADEDLVRRRDEQYRWAEVFLRRAHRLGLGISAEEVRDQRNLQIDHTYEHTSSLLSVGVSGVSYIPFEIYYETPMDIEQYTEDHDALKFKSVPSSLRGDLHGTLVKSIQMGIDLNELTRKYGVEEVDAALSHWPVVQKLGVTMRGGKISFRSQSVTKLYLAKYFLTSPDIHERMRERFDADYDPSTNYFTELARLLDGELMLKLGRLTPLSSRSTLSLPLV